MILGFKPRFKEPILNGKKIHTIRVDKGNRWKEYRKIQMATGVRTKQYQQFCERCCHSTQTIEIIRTSDYLEKTIVKIDGRKLTQDEVQQLAWNDGFCNLIDFWMWFRDGFTGKIIHWTDFKY